ncbi:MAG: radical SAM protein [Chloroflexota bacterium]|nr:radical SAM protein [Chloroflexota bacterium]
MEKQTPRLLIVNFAITRECNLRCKHCYSNSTDSPHDNELTTDEAKKVITDIADAGAYFLIFDGGEPLMRDDLYELIVHAKEVGLHTLLGTNATLLASEAADKLKRAAIDALAISLHGADAKTHDTFCGRDGSFERTMAGISNAADAGLQFQINTCLCQSNLNQIDIIADMTKEFGARALEIFDFLPVGRGKDNAELALSPQERRAATSHIIERQLADKTLTYRYIGVPQYIVEMEKTVSGEENKKRFARTCCGAGKRYCSILYEGTVFPCMLLQKRVGNIRDLSLAEILRDSETFKILRNIEKLDGRCKRCTYNQFCMGARCWVFAKTGSLTKDDHTCWFSKEELQRLAVPQKVSCHHCERKAISTCKACNAPLCEEHLLACPLCRARFCHPDSATCFYEHKC